MKRTLVFLMAAVVAACSDSTSPSRVAGRYELVSVNGAPLPYAPPPSSGLYVPVIDAGDLVLRADGTFVLGAGGHAEGGFSLSGSRLLLSGLTAGTAADPAPRATLEGDDLTVQLGDSVPPRTEVPGNVVGTVRPQVTFRFRRARAGEVVAAGLYVATSVNGKGAPLRFAFTGAAGPQVHEVLYDSVTFSDGAFFHRRRAERDVITLPDGRLHTFENQFTIRGSYREAGEYVTLYQGLGHSNVMRTQALTYRAGELSWRSFRASMPYVEGYTRR